MAHGLLNSLQHRLAIAEPVVIPEPEDSIASVHEEGRPALIGWDLRRMVAAIDHDSVGPDNRTLQCTDRWGAGGLFRL